MSSIPIRTDFVSCVLLSRFGENVKMLLLHRSREGYWCHIGGKIEAEESPVQALKREVYEECRVTPDTFYTADFLQQFYQPEGEYIAFIPAFVTWLETPNKILLNGEHSEYCWCGLEDAEALVPYENQRVLYRHIWRQFVERTPPAQWRIKS